MNLNVDSLGAHMSVEAGWYTNPDQTAIGTNRFWDGTTWTEHVHTDFSHVVPNKLSKKDARGLIGSMQQTIHNLEAIINRHGLRQYEDFYQWRESRQKGIDVYLAAVQSEIAKQEEYKQQLSATITSLESEVVNLQEMRELQTFGVYNYEHPADASIELSTQLAVVKSGIKSMIREKTAVSSVTNFTFNNSAAQGKKFVNSLTRLMLRAYNAEAENAVKSVRAGNLSAAQTRLTRAADQVAKNGEMISLYISQEFHELRLKEIEYAYRHLEAVKREKELEREHKAELREQRKAELELKKEQEKLEKEKSHYEVTLSALRAKGDIEGVERMLAKLEDVERAINDVDYRVANIRAGYVYVISNVGSFGHEVVKIGMTRRLEPMDRVRELGDASVPFRFDVHALFFADDAVAIENMLHNEFSYCRINQVNLRREYFQTTPHAVLETLKEHDVEILEFKIEPEAAEYTESIVIRESLINQS